MERRETVIAELDGDVLRFEGKAIRFPPQALDALGALVEAESPVAGQFTTPCVAGMNTSVRSHASRTSPKYGTA